MKRTKYVFVINFKSGKKRKTIGMIKKIENCAKVNGIDYCIVYLDDNSSFMNNIEKICREYPESEFVLRIYACGGDGTVNHVVNASYGFGHVEIGAIPMGSGNDYIRNYGKVSQFLNIDNQIKGNSVYSDLIEYDVEINGEHKCGFCVNMFNIGYDCNVVDFASKTKRLPLVNGAMAYLIAVCVVLIKKKGADLKIEYDDGTVTDKKILLMSIGNGCYCGGGIKGVPECVLDDGFMDVSVLNNISRRLFIAFFPRYYKGRHLGAKEITEGKILKYTKEKSLNLIANTDDMRVCIDGDITNMKTMKLKIAEKGFKFIVPCGV